MTQLNTPYPATAYLTGFLRAKAVDLDLTVTQADASLELFLRLYSTPLGRAWPRFSKVAHARCGARHTRRRRRSHSFSRSRRATSRRSTPACAFCRAATRASRCASSAASSCPRGRASLHLATARRRRSARLGVRQPRHDRSREAPREPLRRRSRRRLAARHRPALRALALRRAARGQRTDVRAARGGARRRADARRRRCSTSSRASSSRRIARTSSA